MKVFRYLASHKLALVLVFIFLIAQAACELSLPTLTSSIVDIGIQQSGVEHVATDGLSEETHDAISILLEGKNRDIFEKSYFKSDGGNYELTDFGQEHLKELDSIIEFPLVVIHDRESFSSSSVDLEQILNAYRAGEISDAEVQSWLISARESLDAGAEALISQKAISAAISEYSLLGYDLTDIQMRYLITCGALMLALTLCSMIFAIIVGFIAARTGASIGRDLRRRLFENVVAFSEADINRFSAASLITRGTNDIQQIQMVSIMLMRMILYAPILAIGGIIMVVFTNPNLGWIVVVALLVLLFVLAILFRLTMPKFKLMQKLIDKVNLVSREMLEGMTVIRAFDRQSFEENRFYQASYELRATQLFTNRAMSFMMPMMMLIMNLTSVAIIWFGGIQVNDGITQTGDLIAFITYSMVVIMSFLMIGMVSIMLPRASVSAQRVDEVINTVPSISDPRECIEINTCKSESLQNPIIQFDDVSFRYDDESKYVLENVSFSVNRGDTFAIIGSTGSGKSTILKLIERFFDVNEGRVLFGGCDIRSIRIADLRSQLGYVPQKSFLFSGTIDTNVAYSDEGMFEQDVMRALEIAQASEFVSDMPDGVRTSISQGGTNVSGGQRQRIAIARAIADYHPILLFDDSFSALDYKTDAALRHALAEELEGVTKIIVAQRISTVMDADQILVLDEGRVVGCGTHSELLQNCDEYKDIALSQLSANEVGLGSDA